MFRVYLRCSTDDQTVASQRHAVKSWLAVHGADAPARWYEDEGFSGADQDRPAFRRLMKDVKAGDAVLCFAVDRITREGILATLQLRQTLKAKGAKLASVSEPWLSDDNPAAEVVTAVLAWAAEHERKRIRARQRQGIDAAREANGGRCPWGGRKAGTRVTLTPEKERLCRKMKADGETVAAIGRTLGLSRKTVYVALDRPAG
jgi:DNA invertase Pin-like site-specific DNA recombinase